jgi:hypothetical protein
VGQQGAVDVHSISEFAIPRRLRFEVQQPFRRGSQTKDLIGGELHRGKIDIQRIDSDIRRESYPRREPTHPITPEPVEELLHRGIEGFGHDHGIPT